jgi:hypothetical protein
VRRIGPQALSKTQDLHSKFILELTDQEAQSWALDFDDLMAIPTAEMMVLGHADWFVMLTLVVAGPVAPINESHFRQDSQGSVYRSQTDVRVLLTCPLEDAFGVQVFFSSFDYIQHNLAWRVTRRPLSRTVASVSS